MPPTGCPPVRPKHVPASNWCHLGWLAAPWPNRYLKEASQTISNPEANRCGILIYFGDEPSPPRPQRRPFLTLATCFLKIGTLLAPANTEHQRLSRRSHTKKRLFHLSQKWSTPFCFSERWKFKKKRKRERARTRAGGRRGDNTPQAGRPLGAHFYLHGSSSFRCCFPSLICQRVFRDGFGPAVGIPY